MKLISSKTFPPASSTCGNCRAGASVGGILLILVCLGLGAAALWLYLGARSPAGSESVAGQNSGLSEATRSILKRLGSPVEIRFYSLLDPAASSDSLRAFSDRVNNLLAEYQTEGGGKIKLSHFLATPAVSGAAAFADGIRAFNLDKGDGCYLGLTLECAGRKESFARLMPEWEPALESDVSRAIARVAEAPAATPVTAGPAATDPAVIADVKRALPNFADVSVKQGSELLREAALKEFTAAIKDMKAELDAAQQRLVQAQNGGSETEQQDAMKNLQQLQGAQTEKLKEISARSRAQIEAFERMKAAGH